MSRGNFSPSFSFAAVGFVLLFGGVGGIGGVIAGRYDEEKRRECNEVYAEGLTTGYRDEPLSEPLLQGDCTDRYQEGLFQGWRLRMDEEAGRLSEGGEGD